MEIVKGFQVKLHFLTDEKMKELQFTKMYKYSMKYLQRQQNQNTCPQACSFWNKFLNKFKKVTKKLDENHQNFDQGLVVNDTTITEDLGMIEYIFTDKTGTLTENQMVLKSCKINTTTFLGSQAKLYKKSNAHHLSTLSKTLQPTHKKLGPATHNSKMNNKSSISFANFSQNLSKTFINQVNFLQNKNLDKIDIPKDTQLINILKNIFLKQNFENLSEAESEILEFFIGLAICNSVQVSSNLEVEELAEAENETSEYSSERKIQTLQNSSKQNSPHTSRRKYSDPDLRKNRSNHNSKLFEYTYDSESPDELALVYAAQAYGFQLITSNNDVKIVEIGNSGFVRLPGNLVSNKTLKFKVIETIKFTSDRKKMSILVQHPLKNSKNFIYTKGADEVLLHSENPKYEIFSPEILNYAHQGLRTLCLGYKSLDSDPQCQNLTLNSENIEKHSEILESNLNILGITGVEDKLQAQVPETLSALNQAGINIWIITGDKTETAISIGKSSQIIQANDYVHILDSKLLQENSKINNFNYNTLSQTNHSLVLEKMTCINQSILKNPSKNHVLVVDGKILKIIFTKHSLLPINLHKMYPEKNFTTKNPKYTANVSIKTNGCCSGKSRGNKTESHYLLRDQFLTLIKSCKSVINSRVTPQQKGQIVQFVKNSLQVQTLAIGDGANDVNMIQLADVGIGISGKEGKQASMSSDFSLPKFHYLKRLILMHGHLTYYRLVTMILYFLYKNFVFVLLIFWYQVISDFQNLNPVDEFVLIIIDILFNGLPPLILGIFDYDINPQNLCKQNYYKLYEQGRCNKLYTWKNFIFFISLGIYQSGSIFYLCYFTWIDTIQIDYLSFSWLLIICAMLANYVTYFICMRKIDVLRLGLTFENGLT